MRDNLAFRFIIISLIVLAFACTAEASVDVFPLRTTATFSTQSQKKQWSVPIKSTDGTVQYVLSLEPDFDVEHHVVTVELILQRPSTKPNGPNLLDPTGRRHGLQAYDFAANDLARGIQHSAFGKERIIRLTILGIVVRIVVSKATVSLISSGKYQVNSLELQIEVENITG